MRAKLHSSISFLFTLLRFQSTCTHTSPLGLFALSPPGHSVLVVNETITDLTSAPTFCSQHDTGPGKITEWQIGGFHSRALVGKVPNRWFILVSLQPPSIPSLLRLIGTRLSCHLWIYLPDPKLLLQNNSPFFPV